MEKEKPDGWFEQVLAAAPACELDAEGRRAQKARYGRIARSVTEVRRQPEVVQVDLDGHVGPAIVDELIAVEAGCCPWLRFGFDRVAGRLDVSVTDPAMSPALDAIQDAFAAASL